MFHFTASITKHTTVQGLHGPIEVDIITIYDDLDNVYTEAAVTRSTNWVPYNAVVEEILRTTPYTWD